MAIDVQMLIFALSYFNATYHQIRMICSSKKREVKRTSCEVSIFLIGILLYFLCFLTFSYFLFLFYLSKSSTNLFYSDRKRRIYDAPQMRPNNGQPPFGKKKCDM